MPYLAVTMPASTMSMIPLLLLSHNGFHRKAWDRVEVIVEHSSVDKVHTPVLVDIRHWENLDNVVRPDVIVSLILNSLAGDRINRRVGVVPSRHNVGRVPAEDDLGSSAWGGEVLF